MENTRVARLIDKRITTLISVQHTRSTLSSFTHQRESGWASVFWVLARGCLSCARYLLTAVLAVNQCAVCLINTPYDLLEERRPHRVIKSSSLGPKQNKNNNTTKACVLCELITRTVALSDVHLPLLSPGWTSWWRHVGTDYRMIGCTYSISRTETQAKYSYILRIVIHILCSTWASSSGIVLYINFQFSTRK